MRVPRISALQFVHSSQSLTIRAALYGTWFYAQVNVSFHFIYNNYTENPYMQAAYVYRLQVGPKKQTINTYRFVQSSNYTIIVSFLCEINNYTYYVIHIEYLTLFR